MFESLFFAATASSDPNRQFGIFGGITSAEGSLALKVRPAAGRWNGGSSGSVNMMADSDVSGYYFDDALIPASVQITTYQVLDAQHKTTTTQGY